MNDLADQGLAILFASSELNEVVVMADRALVMARGRLTASFEGTEITAQQLADASVKPTPLVHPEDHAA
jgi:erythritol transport system ATP-binding protein